MTDITGRAGQRKRRGMFCFHALKIAGCILLSGSLLTGCGGMKGYGNGTDGQQEDEKISVVTTIFPQYDFVRQIAGDKVELKMLLKPGEETHSYEPTPQDIIAIQNSDVFIYVGGENDAWVEEILESMPDSDMVTLKLMDCVDTLEEEEVEGMQSEPGHIHGEEETHIHEGETAYSVHEMDEHVWTAPENASAIAGEIRDILVKEDPSNSGIYEKNTAEYQKQLDELDQQFRDVVSSAKRNMVIFGDRFPFRYFADAYDLDYYAAFPGCASDTEPSAATMAFLINKVKEEKVPAVLKMELSNENIANAIAEATGTEVKTFYSCHNLTAEEFESGETYLSMMEKNVETLKEVLN